MKHSNRYIKSVILIIVTSITLGLKANCQSSLLTGLKGYWALDETSGNAIDAHEDNDGVVYNAINNQTGKLATAYSFDGNNDYISIPNSTGLNIQDNTMSVSAWIKPTVTGLTQMIVSKVYQVGYHNYPYFQYNLQLHYANSKLYPRFFLSLGGNATYAANTSLNLTLNQWYLVTGTYDGTTMRLYLDGDEVATQSASGNISGYSTPVYIGVNGAQGEDYNGLVDEVGIWDRTLSAAEVDTLYNSGNGSGYPFQSSQAPAAPTNLDVTLSSFTASLSWTDNSTDETIFSIERKTGAGTYSEIATVSANVTSYNNSNLSPSTTYYYRVRAYNSNGYSGYSYEDFITTGSSGTSALQTKLVSYWNLEESSGSVIDVHGSNDGTLSGALRGQTGKINSAYSFDGSNDYVEMPHSSTLNISDTISIAAWIKLDGDADNQWILGKPPSSSSHVSPWGSYILGVNKQSGLMYPIFAVAINNDLKVLYSTESLSLGQWYHITGVYDKTSLKIYVNGTLKATMSQTGTITTFTTPVRIGINGGYSEAFDGLIDEVGLWNRALQSSEVTELYNSGAGLEYPFEESSVETGDFIPQYNGNISQATWKSAYNNEQLQYVYHYDALNRLTDGYYANNSNSSLLSGYNETGIKYDLNGNILQLKRNTINISDVVVGMDDLEYYYTGNQLTGVNDIADPYEGFIDGSSAQSQYTYDDNGNLITDENKNISHISYNILNLPDTIRYSSGAFIVFTYDATGRKLKKQVFDTQSNPFRTTEYINNIEYEDNVISIIHEDEGVLRFNSGNSTFGYEYFLKDHLGNTRVVVNEQGTILQNVDYYPFGLAQSPIEPNSDNNYLYNGKELTSGYNFDEIGGNDIELGWLDYGARFLDPALGRWNVIDGKAEKYSSTSPYTYALNNPVKFIDPDGNIVIAINGAAQQAILNTLCKDDLAYIRFDNNGMIDRNYLNSATSNSGNFNALKQLVNDERTFEFNVSDKFTYKDENGNLIENSFGPILQGEDRTGNYGANTGEEGFLGTTQTPGDKPQKYNSPDNSIKIVINSGLSVEGQAQTTAHEAYGHAYLYSLGENHVHQMQSTSKGFVETNEKLKEVITNAVKETIKNMEDKNNEN